MEMKVLSSCLGRWISEVDEEIVALTQDLRSIEASISIMYDDANTREEEQSGAPDRAGGQAASRRRHFIK